MQWDYCHFNNSIFYILLIVIYRYQNSFSFVQPYFVLNTNESKQLLQSTRLNGMQLKVSLQQCKAYPKGVYKLYLLINLSTNKIKVCIQNFILGTAWAIGNISKLVLDDFYLMIFTPPSLKEYSASTSWKQASK